MTAAAAATLAALKGFTVAADATLVVFDQAAALLNAGNATGLAKATHVSLSGSNSVTAAQATALAGLRAFSLGTDATLAVTDTAAKLTE